MQWILTPVIYPIDVGKVVDDLAAKHGWKAKEVKKLDADHRLIEGNGHVLVIYTYGRPFLRHVANVDYLFGKGMLEEDTLVIFFHFNKKKDRSKDKFVRGLGMKIHALKGSTEEMAGFVEKILLKTWVDDHDRR